MTVEAGHCSEIGSAMFTKKWFLSSVNSAMLLQNICEIDFLLQNLSLFKFQFRNYLIFKFYTNHKICIESKTLSTKVANKWFQYRSGVILQVSPETNLLTECLIALIALVLEFICVSFSMILHGPFTFEPIN